MKVFGLFSAPVLVTGGLGSIGIVRHINLRNNQENNNTLKQTESKQKTQKPKGKRSRRKNVIRGNISWNGEKWENYDSLFDAQELSDLKQGINSYSVDQHL